MKPLLATFFLVLLGFSLFFDDEKENSVQESNLNAEKSELVTVKQDDYETFYAKIIHETNDTVVKKTTFKDFFTEK